MLVTAWLISDAVEHSFSYTYSSLIMNKIRFVGTRKFPSSLTKSYYEDLWHHEIVSYLI